MLLFFAVNAALYQYKNNKKMLTLRVKWSKHFRGKALIPHQELVSMWRENIGCIIGNEREKEKLGYRICSERKRR